MIYPAKYNGINFSYDFSRESLRYDFNNQRLKNILPKADTKYISFYCTDVAEEGTALLKIMSDSGVRDVEATIVSEQSGGAWIFYFEITALDYAYLFPTPVLNQTISFSMQVDTNVIYSEIYELKSTAFLTENEICKVIASNNDNRHGYLSNEAFGFFKFSKLKSDIFLSKTVNYEYSYSRKKILSSENNIAKRFTFQDLTMYQQNLLKWLCNCENISIDGVSYQLISDFTEVEADDNSEICSLKADFVEVNQSFFGQPSTEIPTNVFVGQFFIK